MSIPVFLVVERWKAFAVFGLLTGCCVGFSGCSLGLEAGRGNTWTVGLARVSTGLERLDDHTYVAARTEEAVPLSLMIVPYGLVAGVGLGRETDQRVFSGDVTNEWVACRTYGMQFGSGILPWRAGLTHHRIPVEGSFARIRVNTVKGASLKFRPDDYAVRVGYSRSTVTEGESTNGLLTVEYGPGAIAPLITLSQTTTNQ